MLHYPKWDSFGPFVGGPGPPQGWLGTKMYFDILFSTLGIVEKVSSKAVLF